MKKELTLGVLVVVLLTAYVKPQAESNDADHMVQYFLRGIRKVKAQVDLYTSPKETLHLVSEANLQWLKRSVSKKSAKASANDPNLTSEQKEKADEGGKHEESDGKVGDDDYWGRP